MPFNYGVSASHTALKSVLWGKKEDKLSDQFRTIVRLITSKVYGKLWTVEARLKTDFTIPRWRCAEHWFQHVITKV